jgi:hypothetical protein
MISDTDPSQTSIIQSLTQDVASLKESVNRWNRRYIGLLVFSLILGVCTVYSQYKAILLGGQLSNAQTQLDREKDRKLAVDLHAQDLEMAELNKAAGDANGLAGAANERAAKLESEAAELRLKHQDLLLVYEQLRKGNIEAAAALDKEKRGRMELEASLLDRIFRDQFVAIEALRKFAGTKAVIEYLDNRECKATAEQINLVLDTAKWIVTGKPSDEDFLFEGVQVSLGTQLPEAVIPTPGKTVSPEAFRDAVLGRNRAVMMMQPAAGALIAELNNGGIEARTSAFTSDVPTGTVVVVVGAKPNPVLRSAAQRQPQGAMSGNRAKFRNR